MAKNKKGANKAREGGKLPEIGSMAYWRRLAKQVCPKLDDANELEEVAAILEVAAKLLGKHQNGISKVCKKNEDMSVSVSFAVGIDRRSSPAEIKVKLSYAEKHSDTLKVKSDPNQNELPLEVVEDTQETAPLEAEAGGDEPGN